MCSKTKQSAPENTADFTIPVDVMFKVVWLCVIGYSRTDIAKKFIEDKPEWLQPIKHHSYQNKVKLLSQRFRTADPRDRKFSRTKYQQHYEQCQDSYHERLDNYYDAFINKLIAEHINNDPDTADLITQLKQRFRKAVKDGLIKIIPKIPTNDTDEDTDAADW